MSGMSSSWVQDLSGVSTSRNGGWEKNYKNENFNDMDEP